MPKTSVAHTRFLGLAIIAALGGSACSATLASTHPESPVKESATTVRLHGKPLELHVSTPQTPVQEDVFVLYASGDGGWFGTAVDMFRLIGRSGYRVVGFSSRAFLKLDRPQGGLVDAAQLADEYGTILKQAREAMAVSASTPVVLTGWSRGAAFAVLVASEAPARAAVRGVVAIGLDSGEDLQINGAADETDDGKAAATEQTWPFLPYARIAALGPMPCAVIQATNDNYLPAAKAHQLFGVETDVRRFYSIAAKNHRFSGGTSAFADALVDAVNWAASSHRLSQPAQ